LPSWMAKYWAIKVFKKKILGASFRALRNINGLGNLHGKPSVISY